MKKDAKTASMKKDAKSALSGGAKSGTGPTRDPSPPRFIPRQLRARKSIPGKADNLHLNLNLKNQEKRRMSTTPTTSTGAPSPQREVTPSLASSIPQKRALEDDHQPAVSSPLNPDFKPLAKPKQEPQDDAPFAQNRAPRAKKESLKKRESNVRPAGASSHHGGHETSSRRATPDPKSSSGGGAGGALKKRSMKNVVTPQRFKLPPPKLSDFEVPRGPVFTPSHTKVAPDGSEIQFNETTDHVLNKKLFHYTQCVADPAFQRSNYYRRTDIVPFGPAISLEDTATHMFLDETAHHVTTDKGWRMAKGNVCVRHGRFYWECKITSGISKKRKSEAEESKGHVRMGWARREATLDAPVGFDAYSYALRDVAGQKVYLSRPQNFFPPGEEIREGDVIGLEINLPSENLHRKVVDGHFNPAVDLADDEKPGLEAADIIRDRVPIRFKTHTYFEQVEYHSAKELEELVNPSPLISSTGGLSGPPQEPGYTHPQPALRTLPHSSITVYKNGKLMGTPFKDLLAFLPPASKPHIDKTQVQIGAREGLDDGMLGYYPAISVFRGGAAEVNFGPDFWYPPPDYNNDDQDDEVDMIGNDHPPQPKATKIRAVSERFDEQIVEDILFDIIDEVDFWVQDGMPDTDVSDGVTRDAAAGANVLAPDGELGSEGIKELVQDDE